jgi:hypothetical protein
MSPCAVQANTLAAEEPQMQVMEFFVALGSIAGQSVPLKRIMVPLSPPAKISESDEPQMLLRLIVVPVSISVQSSGLPAQACRADIKQQNDITIQAAPVMLRFIGTHLSHIRMGDGIVVQRR